ncbi:MAG: hypothetical protein HOP29_15245 [Phycisphaerales bacterium]|nr:hypothetical protein [Phycisphaerales bacterium]
MKRGIVGVMVCGFALFVGACKEETQTEDALKYSPEEQAMREKIHRDGRVTRALEEFLFAIGSYPTTEQGLRGLVEKPKGLSDPAAWQGPYLLDEADLLDTWGHEFKYSFPGKTHEGKYDIVSFGPDGAEGTGDDYLNWNIR